MTAYRYRQIITTSQRIYSMGYSQVDIDAINGEIQKLIETNKTDAVDYLVK